MKMIYEHQGTFKKMIAKTSALQKRMREFQMVFAMAGPEGKKRSKREIYQMSRQKVDAIFDTLLPIIAAKREALMQAAKDNARQRELHKQLQTAKDPREVAKILKEIDDIAQNTDKQFIAFKQPDGTVAIDKWMASTYHDEFASSHAGSFRYWFVCKCNHSGWRCQCFKTTLDLN
jgi:hypothetical protein